MALNYNPLWKLLIDKGMKKTVLVEKVGISKSTLAKMGKNQYVALEVIERICLHFNCGIEDIIQIISENK